MPTKPPGHVGGGAAAHTEVELQSRLDIQERVGTQEFPRQAVPSGSDPGSLPGQSPAPLHSTHRPFVVSQTMFIGLQVRSLVQGVAA
jgi:hypothetical protein